MTRLAALLQDGGDIASVGYFNPYRIYSIWRKHAANRFGLADYWFLVGCNGLDRIFQIVTLDIHSSSADSFVGVIDRSAIDDFSIGVDEKRLGYMSRLQHVRKKLRTIKENRKLRFVFSKVL